ncbi:HK97 family phage prohead protease [Lentzea sp. JNUCC 0626]|uniref:HK97 family phage prohead protease n=1 Tax=Lentzea sp. JNUCC 0626 TaxID=3367513 RepID=UPI0037485F2E
MHIKTAPVQIKAAGAQDGTDEGVFEAIVSAFDVVDTYGDVVLPGAFTETLKEWADSGDPIPVLWSHAATDPDYHIGWVLAAEERDEGLWVRAQIDPDDLADPKSKAAKVYRLLKGRRVKQFSFAFDVLDAGWAERDGNDVYELRRLKLYEVGPTLVGVNQSTELLDVKRRKENGPRSTPSGGETSGADEAQPPPLAAVVSALQEIKALLTGHTHASEQATPSQPADTESPTQAAPVEPARTGTASARLRADFERFDAEVFALTNEDNESANQG